MIEFKKRGLSFISEKAVEEVHHVFKAAFSPDFELKIFHYFFASNHKITFKSGFYYKYKPLFSPDLQLSHAFSMNSDGWFHVKMRISSSQNSLRQSHKRGIFYTV